MDEEPTHSQVLLVPVQEPDAGSRLQEFHPLEGSAEDTVGEGSGGGWEVEGTVQIRDLLAEARCNQAALDFLSTTDVGGGLFNHTRIRPI